MYTNTNSGFFFFSSRRRHTRCLSDWSSDVCSSDLVIIREADIRVATQAMLDLAYEPGVPLSAIDAQKTVGEYAFLKPGTDLLVEFHTERTFRYHPRRLQIEKLFEPGTFVTIDGRQVLVLSLRDELVL